MTHCSLHVRTAGELPTGVPTPFRITRLRLLGTAAGPDKPEVHRT
jgi:hypothetical protein